MNGGDELHILLELHTHCQDSADLGMLLQLVIT